MSKITQRPAVGILNPFGTASTASNYIGTSTPISGAQAYSANPANGAQPTPGTGFYDPNFCTYVGEKFDTADGRELVLVANGVGALAAGTLVQQAAPIAAFSVTALAITVPTATPATAGSFQILVTNGTTVLNVNQYAQGYIIVSAGTGIGQMFKISSHQPAISGATFLVTLEDAIQVTLDATSKVNLHYNQYGGLGGSGTTGSPTGGVIINPTTQTSAPVGMTLTAIAASVATTYTSAGLVNVAGTVQYGLIACHGFAAGTNDAAGTLTAGAAVMPSTSVAGAVRASTGDVAVIGNAVTAATASTSFPIMLNM
jgi:hypothetical protein